MTGPVQTSLEKTGPRPPVLSEWLCTILASDELAIEISAPATVLVGQTNFDIRCKYSFTTGTDVSVTSIELQKEWPRGSDVFQTIAIFFPPDGAEPTFSSSDVASRIESRATLTKPYNESLSATITYSVTECEDEGRYKCSAHYHSSSGAGTIYNSVYMKTVAKAKAPYAAPVLSVTGGLIENEIVEFTCKADVGKPAGKIHWWLYSANKSVPLNLTSIAINTPIPVQNPGICDTNIVSTLPFHANKDDNNAKLRCSVDQELLTRPTGQLQDIGYKETGSITVFYAVRKPEVTKVPDKLEYNVNTSLISMKCSTFGNPNPFLTDDDERGKVTWYFKRSINSQEIFATRVPNIHITKREVKVNNLNESQAGIYICEVQNSFKGNTYVQRTEVQIKMAKPNKIVTTPATPERNHEYLIPTKFHDNLRKKGTSQSSFQGTVTNGAPPGIKIEVSIDEAIMALGRKNDGTRKDVITHDRTTIMH
ncbi:hypothetical protein FSP39_011846 [Pinctada imbricata]|uniref:Ig-like domain-containing protein n=1 Tax=Pinctada imbricata TaxID=66713 RepID=A0AA89CDZ0_PINIB|nr:hypothetical protein FSP39_011846 [Pinctada imbricata]